MLGLGLATMLVGGYRALRQTDIKLILAYGTVSQLGFLTMVVGLGTPDAALAGLPCSWRTGCSRPRSSWWWASSTTSPGPGTSANSPASTARPGPWAIVAAIGAASMAGIPPLAGFVAKESVFEAFIHYSAGPAAGRAAVAARRLWSWVPS